VSLLLESLQMQVPRTDCVLLVLVTTSPNCRYRQIR